MRHLLSIKCTISRMLKVEYLEANELGRGYSLMIKAPFHTQSKLDCTHAIGIALKTRDIDEMRYWSWSIRRYQLFKVIIWSTCLMYILLLAISWSYKLISRYSERKSNFVSGDGVDEMAYLLQSLVPYMIIYRPSCTLLSRSNL